MTEKIIDPVEKLNREVERQKTKMRDFLMGKTKEERFRILREDLSLKGINTMCEWALPEEDYEICQSVQEVIADNLAEFDIRFVFEEIADNKANVVKFRKPDGINYYHADFILPDGIDGFIVNLFRQPDGSWYSAWKTSEQNYFQPIGAAIGLYEKAGINPDIFLT